MCKRKILIYISGLNVGGAETFIYNLIKKIDKNKFCIDFCLQQKQNGNTELLSLISEYGGKIFYINPFNKNYFASKKQLRQIILENEYDCIHIHSNSLINYSPVAVAYKLGLKVIIHSHNTLNASGGTIGKILHKFNRYRLRNKNITCIACGNEAGQWMFGSKSFTVIPNGIDCIKYKFSLDSRNKIRNQFAINPNDILLGHVGRFLEQKNHKFIIELAVRLCKINKNLKFMLVGDGALKEEMVRSVRRSGLEENIIFTGNRTNIWEFYSAFDAFVFPSLFEGTPFTLIEAQASGLIVFASDAITKNVKVCDLINFLNLDLNCWCEVLSNIKTDLSNREKYADLLNNSEFDSMHFVKIMECIYETN